jgi:DNA-binding transcriptional ArsR family regulator
MADHKAPDYDLETTLQFETPEQYKALFEETRLQIVDLLLERAATIKELSETLDRPKGTIGHHVSVLEDAGLIRVVRTKMVRAIEAKYYGRTARTYLLGDKMDPGFEMAANHFLTTAIAEYAAFPRDAEVGPFSTLRYARIPDERADEWQERLTDLVHDFTAEERDGETTFGLLVAMYPTDRPHLPDDGEEDE